jgi:hypothetical protein
MRALGFKGSGGRYVLPDADRWLIVAFQKNRYSTAESVSFTVNLTAANKEAWEKFRGGWGLAEQPSGNAVYPGVDVIRLGPIAKTIGYDRWWDVSPHDSGAAPDVLEAIETYGIPWLRSSRPGVT